MSVQPKHPLRAYSELFFGVENTLVLYPSLIRMCGNDMITSIIVSQTAFKTARSSTETPGQHGWFEASADFLESICVSDDQLKYRQNALAALGVEFHYGGFPKRRYMRMNFPQFEKCLEDFAAKRQPSSTKKASSFPPPQSAAQSVESPLTAQSVESPPTVSGKSTASSREIPLTDTSYIEKKKDKEQYKEKEGADGANAPALPGVSKAKKQMPSPVGEQTPTPTPSQADVQKDSSSQVAENKSPSASTTSKSSRRGGAAQKTDSEAKFDPYKVDLPECVPRDEWIGFLDVRKAKRVPNTERAIGLTLAGLVKAEKNGWNAREMLEEAIMRGWTGCVFDKHRKPRPAEQPSRQGYARGSVRDAILNEEVTESREETRARLEQEVRREASRYKRRGEE